MCHAMFELTACATPSICVFAGDQGSRFWRFCLAGAVAARLVGRRQSVRYGRVQQASKTRTELLVDADQHSIEMIREAISCLKSQGRQVHTKVFAPPGRTRSKKWQQFMKDPKIKFQPVARSADHSAEANDEAISLAMRELSTQSTRVGCIALLTGDIGFLDTMMELKAAKPRFTLLVPEEKFTAAGRYQDAGLEVLTLKRRSQGSCVRAVLQDDGRGSVELSDPYMSFDNKGEEGGAGLVMAFLTDLGYWKENEYLLPACGKFWYANGLGSLVVHPTQLATIAVEKIISSRTQSWKPYNDDLGFFFPVSAACKFTDQDREVYGNRLARSIFRGGGPFVLEDSDTFAIEALSRLGYLDHDLNADEHEAMLCFMNTSDNKQRLRKLDLLPTATDRSQDVKDKLRKAFLSNRTPNQWTMWFKTSFRKPIQQILSKEKLIKKSQRSNDEIMKAMKAYAKKHQLAPRRTFNGLAQQIAYHNNTNHNKRAMIDFGR